MSLRQEKVISLIKEIAGEFIRRESDKNSLITVSNVSVSPDLKTATIFVTVFPENNEGCVANIDAYKFRNFTNSRLKLKFLPKFEFKIDENEKKRRRIEELLK